MADTVSFIIGFHNHQPVGNFDHVFEEAFQKAYMPLLEVLFDYPDIPFALHSSGVLWDWLVDSHPEYMDRLAAMVSRGQVELMSGGYYEPILSVIPERDRQGQLSVMERFLHERFGQRPRGCWLTERIWEPHLPETLHDARLEYVVVDDAHFKSTGFDSEEMRGYFRTEEDGKYINVFPIDKRLRYLIPFADPAETVEYLRGIAAAGPGVAVLADDGEKFGLWPGTHELCYVNKWLRRFCDELMKHGDWLELSTFSRILDRRPPQGIVYLPTAAYTEMMEWALPLGAQERFERAERALADTGSFEDPATIVRGGFWRNFLVKYSESNWMHKRMLAVSGLVEEYRRNQGEDESWAQARNHLYQAQCNCAYWHGLFGGLYLPHLRSAVYTHLIAAENEIEARRYGDGPYVEHQLCDLDGDGRDELVISTASMRILWGLRGGALRELDLRDPPFNLTDTLTRREELYHRKLAVIDTDAAREDAEAVSIHNISTVKERHLDRYLAYDFHIRQSFLDHFVAGDVSVGDFARAAYEERGDFIDGCYECTVSEPETGPVFVLKRAGAVTLDGAKTAITLEKSVRPSPSRPELAVTYRIAPTDGALRCRFAVESVFSFLAGNAPDRYFKIPGRDIAESHLASTGEERDVGSVSIIDEWLGVALACTFEPRVRLWRFPIETVSNSESGFERVYQGSAVVPVWDLDIGDGGSARFVIRLSVGRIGA
jgi:alpha-amylase